MFHHGFQHRNTMSNETNMCIAQQFLAGIGEGKDPELECAIIEEIERMRANTDQIRIPSLAPNSTEIRRLADFCNVLILTRVPTTSPSSSAIAVVRDKCVFPQPWPNS